MRISLGPIRWIGYQLSAATAMLVSSNHPREGNTNQLFRKNSIITDEFEKAHNEFVQNPLNEIIRLSRQRSLKSRAIEGVFTTFLQLQPPPSPSETSQHEFIIDHLIEFVITNVVQSSQCANIKIVYSEIISLPTQLPPTHRNIPSISGAHYDQ